MIHVEAGLLAILLLWGLSEMAALRSLLKIVHQQICCLLAKLDCHSLASPNLVNLLLQTVFSGDTYTRGSLQMPTMTGNQLIYANLLQQDHGVKICAVTL